MSSNPSPGGKGASPVTHTAGRRHGPKRQGLKKIPDLLRSVLGPEAKRRGLAEARLLTDWADIVGEALATHCQPVSLGRNGILHLDVTGAAALELQHAELQVIERINTFFGRPTVARLHLRQSPPKRRTLKPKAVPPPPLDAADKAKIGKTVNGVDDPNLRAALASLGETLGSDAKARRR